jgi:hypothetical protein
MIEEALLKSNYIGKDGFYWWIGQVANQNSWKGKSKFSEEKGSDGKVWAARCKVRIVGHHTFDGNVLSDEDLPWAQIMMDPIFGSGHGGMGATINLKGGETCFGFFIDGDDAQQPVVMGLLHRSDGVKNLISEEVIAKEKSSQFKPFTGHPGNNIPATQRSARKDKSIIPENPQTETPPLSTKDKVDIAFNSNVGFYTGSTNVSFQPQFGDRLQFDAASIWQVAKKADIEITIPNGCQNGLIGDISQALQSFMAITNGLDQYLNVYVDTVLNEIVDIGNQIRNAARSILSIVKLIINNLRNTILKCITWAFRKLIGLIVPQPQQKVFLEAMKEILDKIFCILENLPGSLLDFITGALSDLVNRTVNVPLCAAEEWTAGILAKLMNAIEDALSGIMSGISWLTGGLGTISSILNDANSLASQIFSFLKCTGLACKKPYTWAAKFGPSEKEADDWKKMVSSVNVFKTAANAGSSIEGALRDTSLYSATDTFGSGFGGLIDSALSNVSCASKVLNPQNQDDLMRMPIGSRWKTCIPPQVYITGDGFGAKAIPIVVGGKVVEVKILNGGIQYQNGTTDVRIVDKSNYGFSATAYAIVGAGGSITSIPVTNAGVGYCTGNYNQDRVAGITTFIRITSSENSIDEGESFIIKATTQNISDNTPIKYQISGISDKAVKQNLSGNFTILNNESSIQIDTIKDVIDNSKVLTFSLPEYNKSLKVFVKKLNKPQIKLEKYYLSSSKSNINDGQSFTITLRTENVKNNAKIPYTITGVSGDVLKNQSLKDSFDISNNISKINIQTNKGTITKDEIFKLTLDNNSAFVSVLIKPSIQNLDGPTGDLDGCVANVIVVSPGYGYTNGDTITDGTNIYTPIVSPGSGAIIGVNQLPNSTCGFNDIPTLTINTNTGVGAELIPVMQFTPNYSSTTGIPAVSGIGIAVTSVIDCV